MLFYNIIGVLGKNWRFLWRCGCFCYRGTIGAKGKKRGFLRCCYRGKGRGAFFLARFCFFVKFYSWDAVPGLLRIVAGPMVDVLPGWDKVKVI